MCAYSPSIYAGLYGHRYFLLYPRAALSLNSSNLNSKDFITHGANGGPFQNTDERCPNN